MKRVLFVIAVCLGFTVNVGAQEAKSDSMDYSVLIGTLTAGDFIYPLTDDKFIGELKYGCSIIYPLLIVNGVVIRDEDKVNKFRNHYADKIGRRMFGRRVKGVKSFTQQEAIKLGIMDVPKDGVVWVTLPKKYIIDL